MKDGRAQLVKQLFEEAAELGPGERECFLAGRCENDATLKAEVFALLGSDGTGPFLEGAGRTESGPTLPKQIGHYVLSRRIADGGMGLVFEAVQENPRRSVALKLLRGELLSPEARRRFEYEARTLARLQHPGIAQIYEGGTQNIGGINVPYFAMELISDARPITSFSREQNLDTRRRLALFVEVCDAVQHGHQRGVIHRDLKPSNILVDSTGRPRVIDFGIARSADAAGGTTATLFTAVGQIVGTVPYMSPEQFGGAGHDVDVRSDVYSLGVVLYELLCERLPFDIGRADLLEAARIVREQFPTRPSAVNRELAGDLETIVLKALDKDPARRYPSAESLAHDCRHYLANEPIEARGDSALYVLRKTVRRHRAAFAVLLAFIVLLAGSTVVAWTLMVRARRSDHESRESLRASLIIQARARRRIPTEGRRTEALEALSRAAAIRSGDDLRDEVISTLAVPDLKRTLVSPPPGFGVACFGNDATRCAAHRDDGTEIVMSVPDGAVIARIPPPSVPVQQWGRLYCDDRQFIRAFGQSNRLQRIESFTIPDAKLRLEISDVPNDEASFQSFDVSPDRRTLAVGRVDHAVHFYDLASGRETRRLDLGNDVGLVRFDPSGTRLARLTPDEKVSIIDLVGGGTTSAFDGSPMVLTLAWSPDGRYLAGSHGLTNRIWDVDRHAEMAILRGHNGASSHVTFSHDGTKLASYGWDGDTLLWDLRTTSLMLQTNLATAFAENDRVVGAIDSPTRGSRAYLCDLLDRDVCQTSGDALRIDDLHATAGAVHPAGRVAVRSAFDDRINAHGMFFFDLYRGTSIGRMDSPKTDRMQFDSTGKWLYAADGRMLRWPVHVDESMVHIGRPEQLLPGVEVYEFDLTPDGNRLAAVSWNDRALIIVDPAHPQRRTAHSISLARRHYTAISPDARWAVVTTWFGTGAEVWDLERNELHKRLDVPGLASPAFSPDGRWLVIRDWNFVRFIDPATWQERKLFPIDRGTPCGFTRNGRLCVAVDNRNFVHLIDTTKLVKLAVFESSGPLSANGAPIGIGDDALVVFGWQGALIQRWDLRLVRSTLATMGLDWDQPHIPPAAPHPPPHPLRLVADFGSK